MNIKERQRCIFCGRFLFNADFELPIEDVSTGTLIAKMDLDINCGHCHRSHVYSLGGIVRNSDPIKIDS